MQWCHLRDFIIFYEGGIRPKRAVIFVHGHGGDGWRSIHRWGLPLANLGLLVILPRLFGYGHADEHADCNGPSIVSDLESVTRHAREMFEPKTPGIWAIGDQAEVAGGPHAADRSRRPGARACHGRRAARVATRIPRYSKVVVTMEVHPEVPSDATRDALPERAAGTVSATAQHSRHRARTHSGRLSEIVVRALAPHVSGPGGQFSRRWVITRERPKRSCRRAAS